MNIYQEHNASKLVDMDELLEEWAGEEAELLAAVRHKYPDTRSVAEKKKQRLKRVQTVARVRVADPRAWPSALCDATLFL